MKRVRFRAPLMDGHKDAAVPVPFDPEEVWGLPAVPLWPRRRGHRVRGKANGVAFESAIVGRARRHFLLIDAALRQRVKAAEGDALDIVVWPDAPDRPAR